MQANAPYTQYPLALLHFACELEGRDETKVDDAEQVDVLEQATVDERATMRFRPRRRALQRASASAPSMLRSQTSTPS
jgi:hypothetical protein